MDAKAIARKPHVNEQNSAECVQYFALSEATEVEATSLAS